MILTIVFMLIVVFSLVYLCSIAKKVLNHSVALKELSQTNSTTNWKPIETHLLKCYTCSSRGEFNRFSLDKFFLEIVSDNRSYFQKMAKLLEFNKRELNKYNKLINSIDMESSTTTARELNIPLSIFRYLERHYFKKMLLSPPTTDICIVCRKEYTTPAGKSHIWSDKEFHLVDLNQYLKESFAIEQQRELRAYHIERERALMTNSLRYDILKRDGFKCQICGSTVQDGVKLHVDHIIPVSRGGHTTPDNLRTLCDRCTSGKSNKIE